MSYKIKLYHLYPDAMNLYGDLGNVIALRKRCEWRGLEFEVVKVTVGDKIDFSDCDILFMGGGQDRGQKTVSTDLQKRGNEINERIEEGWH
jgi:CobQ-like glutamine amidotransferase family enzyme